MSKATQDYTYVYGQSVFFGKPTMNLPTKVAASPLPTRTTFGIEEPSHVHVGTAIWMNGQARGRWARLWRWLLGRRSQSGDVAWVVSNDGGVLTVKPPLSGPPKPGDDVRASVTYS